MQTIAFAPSSSHPLAAVLVGQVGIVTATETRDGVAWLAVEFPDYGSVCLPADEFAPA